MNQNKPSNLCFLSLFNLKLDIASAIPSSNGGKLLTFEVGNCVYKLTENNTKQYHMSICLFCLQWCRKGVCVAYGEEGPVPVDGGWSAYGGWGSCSRTCGGGVKFRERSCTAPRSQYGGKDCAGEDRIYVMCNTQASMNTFNSINIFIIIITINPYNAVIFL